MNKLRILSALLSMMTAAVLIQPGVSAEGSSESTSSASASVQNTSAGSLNAAADQEKTTGTTAAKETADNLFTVTFLDFDGNVLYSMDVPSGGKIDYASVDTSSLHTHPDIYTEKMFYQWDQSPEYAEENISIRALWQSATILLKNVPDKRRYTALDGSIDLDGLEVSITIEKQLTELDEDGNYKISTTTSDDVALSCAAKPATVQEAFSDGNSSAEISIYPIGETKPLSSYKIYYVPDFGDVTGNGIVDAVDASHLLRLYADITEDPKKQPDDAFMLKGDIDGDGKITSADASFVLKYYAAVSADEKTVWDDIIKIK